MSAPEAPRPEPHRFVVLDSWRGLAALGVALHHIGGTAPFLNTALHAQLFSAVDFFFVLSGFVIAASYGERLAHGFPLARFAVLRIGRIWPLHAAMVLVYLGLELGLLLHGGWGATGREPFSGPRDPVALLPTLLLLQTWFWPDRDLWNVQSWSVSVEIALYCGAALLWRGLGARAYWAAPILAAAALAALSLNWGLPTQQLRGVAGFGLGMACWPLWQRLQACPVAAVPATAAEGAVVALVILALMTAQPLVLLDPLFALALLVFAGEHGLLSRLLLTAPARWLGTLSYALYMVHGLVFGRAFDVLAYVQARLGAHWVSSHLGGGDLLMLPALPAALVVTGMLALALMVSWLAWRFVEWPARALSRRLAARIGST